ncbi:hypothetical protein HK102_013593 [Quaeritorhiza haematococci]|nr:hypothetical protein HK102_013593 [Quaeritorhiza haematococci]
MCTNPSKVASASMDNTEAALVALDLLKKSSIQRPNDPEYFFCVDSSEVSNRRKLAEELSGLGFSVAWCVRALQECKDDTGRAAEWLLSNAPPLGGES